MKWSLKRGKNSINRTIQVRTRKIQAMKLKEAVRVNVAGRGHVVRENDQHQADLGREAQQENEHVIMELAKNQKNLAFLAFLGLAAAPLRMI